MLIKKDESCVVLVDIQEKLTPLVLNSEALITRCQWILSLAHQLDISMVLSEQYPKGLGPTHPALAALKPSFKIEKQSFSCLAESSFATHLAQLNKSQVILIGIETHVCILQTALDLIDRDYEVFVVVDAVSARHEFDHRYALKRMKQAGCQLVTAEMLFFEWIRHSKHHDFKRLSQTFLQ